MQAKDCIFSCVFLCIWSWDQCVWLGNSALQCRVLILQDCAVTCCLINSVLLVVGLPPTASAAMIKRDALKGRKPFQFTPDTSWMPSIHLDQNGRSFSSPSHSVTAAFSSTSPSLHLCTVFFCPTNTRSPPSPLTSLTLPVCRGFTSKPVIGFKLLSRQYFPPALC